MLKVYCDGCGKQLKSNFADVINMEFHSYGTAEFDDGETKNFCKSCATTIKEFIEKMPEDRRVKYE